MSTTDAPTNGLELMQHFLPASPFVGHVGMRLDTIAPDEAVVLLPWSEELATYGDILHGGAIGALVDVTAMTTAWSGAPLPEKLRGVTVSMSIEFVDTARAEDVRGHGRVIRRGRSLVNVEVDVRGADDRMIAKGLATYKVG